MNKVLVRSLSGIVYIAIIVAACLWGGHGVSLLACLFGALGIVEFRQMRFGPARNDLGMAVLNALGGIFLIMSPYAFPAVLWLIWLIWRVIMTVYSHHDHPEKEFAVDMAAQLYIALPLALMNLFGMLAYIGDNPFCMSLLAMFIIIWVNDTGAFVFGSIFGRHKLFERVSPKKTWEGFFGGMICSVVAGLLFGMADWSLSSFHIGSKVWFWTIAGLLISIAATYGDLFESVIKRNLHLKDSGNLIPGHGGILDRIDSLLLVIPVMAVYVLTLTAFQIEYVLSQF